MSVLDRIACAQGRRDEAPNQELAGEMNENRSWNQPLRLVLV